MSALFGLHGAEKVNYWDIPVLLGKKNLYGHSSGFFNYWDIPVVFSGFVLTRAKESSLIRAGTFWEGGIRRGYIVIFWGV